LKIVSKEDLSRHFYQLHVSYMCNSSNPSVHKLYVQCHLMLGISSSCWWLLDVELAPTDYKPWDGRLGQSQVRASKLSAGTSSLLVESSRADLQKPVSRA